MPRKSIATASRGFRTASQPAPFAGSEVLVTSHSTNPSSSGSARRPVVYLKLCRRAPWLKLKRCSKAVLRRASAREARFWEPRELGVLQCLQESVEEPSLSQTGNKSIHQTRKLESIVCVFTAFTGSFFQSRNFPADLGRLRSLKELVANGNRLQYLPDSFGFLFCNFFFTCSFVEKVNLVQPSIFVKLAATETLKWPASTGLR